MKTIASKVTLAAPILLTGHAPAALQGAAVIYESLSTLPDGASRQKQFQSNQGGHTCDDVGLSNQTGTVTTNTGNGFTLTELLIVIVIIAALAAILIPTITSFRDRAAAAGCASNMRQCIAVSLMFSTEQNGRLPRLHVTNGQLPGEVGKTPLPVDERIVSNPNTSWWPDLVTTYAEGASMCSCPKLKVNAENALTAGAPSKRVPLGIGINYPYMAPNNTDATKGKLWVRLSEVPDQGRVVWFADAAGEVTGDWKKREDVPGTGSCLFRGASTSGNAVMPRHGGKINVGFVDGHVSLVSPSEINWGSTDKDRSKYIGFTKFQ
jgi:prepilin-type processing-associated H-X9-DG protein/prepilin-type N-terminal cleavage/methylation domain-containing protein